MLKEQDLSLKCSAWKGFIPCLEWKSPSPKQILGRMKYYGSEEVLGPQKFWILKNYWVQKFVKPKQFWGAKSLGAANFWKKVWDRKKSLVWNFFGMKKILGPKKIRVWKNLGSNKIAGSKISGQKSSLVLKRNLGPQKI